jgi:hypothetical protein
MNADGGVRVEGTHSRACMISSMATFSGIMPISQSVQYAEYIRNLTRFEERRCQVSSQIAPALTWVFRIPRKCGEAWPR